MRRGAFASLLALALVALPTPGTSTALSVNQVISVPATGTIVIKGHGYGHGHGMSQYGAQGAATGAATGTKLGYRQIIDFYYPGTTWGTAPNVVRVLVSGDTSRDVVVSPRSGLTVRDRATRESWLLPANGATLWRLDVANGRTVVDYQRSGTWRRWRALTGDGAFRAAGNPLTLHYGGTTHRYRGTLIAASPSAGSGERDTVNELKLDNYLKGVVPREMPASWHAHALRAQAVAARTYASYEMAHRRYAHYDTCDTTSCQVYGGYDGEYASSNAAIDDTAGEIITSGGEPAFTQFSSSSGGWTSANQFSYLPNKQDPYDTVSPNHSWSVPMDVSRIEKAYPYVGNLKSVEFVSREGNGDWQGRAWTMVLRGTNKDGKGTRVETSGDTFRSRLGLKSSWFTVTVP